MSNHQKGEVIEMKGNVIVGQSGGPTAVINSSLAGVYKTAMERGFTKVYGMRYGIQGFMEEQYIDMSEHIKNELDLELLKRTPSAFLGTCRYKLPEIHEDKAVYERIFELLDKLDITVFIYTITDHTPGFGSAAKYIATSIKELICDAMGFSYKKKNVVIIEIMGRNAGWLTGASALAKGEDCAGPDLIYLPERAFDVDTFVSKVRDLLEKQDVVVVTLSEGIHTAEGKYICEFTAGSETTDAFGHIQMTGTASYLAQVINQELGCKTRAVELSTLQRSAAHMASRVDVDEAFAVGGATVKAADEGDSGVMVVIERVSDDPYQSTTGVYDVHRIANAEKVVPTEWINKEGDNVTEEFLDYVRPLIQGHYNPMMVAGLPRHLPMTVKNYKWSN